MNQAQYQNDANPLPDTLIDLSIAYYEGKDKEKFTRAKFYKACSLWKTGRLKEALSLLKDIENVPVSTKTRYRIYSAIGTINTQAGENEEALRYAYKELALSKKIGNMQARIGSLDQMAVVYERIGQKDSAIHYISQCEPLLNQQMTDKVRAIIYINIGYFNRDSNPHKALNYLEKAESIMPSSSLFDNKAYIYANQGWESAADSLWNIAINKGKLSDRIAAVTDMLKHKQDIGDKASASALAFKLLSLKDSLAQKRKNDSVAIAQREYDFQTIIEEKETSLSALLIAIVTTLFFILVGTFYIARRHRIRMGELTNQKEENERIVKEQMRMLEKVTKLQKESTARGSVLFDTLRGNGSIVRWNTQDYEDFFTFYAQKDVTYFMEIKNGYKGLTNINMLYLILMHEGWRKEDVARVLGVKANSLRVMKMRIKEKTIRTVDTIT